MFQSQTRSRPGCHPTILRTLSAQDIHVSISNEKPPRLPHVNAASSSQSETSFQSQTRSRPGCHAAARSPTTRIWPCFNLKREAAPVATAVQCFRPALAICFNLKREAAPVATGGCLAPLLERRDRCVCEADGFFPFKVQNHDPLY